MLDFAPRTASEDNLPRPYPEQLSTICTELADALQANKAVLFLYDQLAGTLTAVAVVNLPETQIVGRTLSLQSSKTLQSILTEGRVVLDASARDVFAASPELGQSLSGSALALLPLHHSGPVGLLAAVGAKNAAARPLQRLGREAAARIRQVTHTQQALEATILKLAESQSLLAAVLDATINGIILVGTDQRVLYANRRMNELFGIDFQQAIGRDKRDLITEQLMGQMADPQAFMDRLFYLYDHLEETAVDEMEVARPTRRILQRYSGPVYKQDGTLLGRIEVYSDVTEIRDLQRNKDEFLSLVSHELRTPVTSIKGYAQLLQRRSTNENIPPRTRTAYATIERQTARMQELIDLLLDLSRLDTGRLRLQLGWLDLAELVKRVAEMVQITTEDHTVTLQFPAGPVWIRGDERRLEQVVMNLLSNAVRYSPDGGSITVSLAQRDGTALVAVKDEGIGIAADSRSRVFERFYNAPDVPESTGLGIGLYISKEIVERHGGTITCESEVGKGSTFTVTLPAGGPATE